MLLHAAAAVLLIGGEASIPRSASIDQQQPRATEAVGAFWQEVTQSFVPLDPSVSGAGVFLMAGAGTEAEVTIRLYDALPCEGGRMLAEAAVIATVGGAGGAGAWAEVSWPPVAVSSDHPYYLAFVADDDRALQLAGDRGNPYWSGEMAACAIGVPHPLREATVFPDTDLAFRTYTASRVDMDVNGAIESGGRRGVPHAVALEPARPRPCGRLRPERDRRNGRRRGVRGGVVRGAGSGPILRITAVRPACAGRTGSSRGVGGGGGARSCIPAFPSATCR